MPSAVVTAVPICLAAARQLPPCVAGDSRPARIAQQDQGDRPVRGRLPGGEVAIYERPPDEHTGSGMTRVHGLGLRDLPGNKPVAGELVFVAR